MDIDRDAILRRLRPSVASQLLGIEATTGLRVVFQVLPQSSDVLATYNFDPHRNTASVGLKDGWDDVDVAHELTHLQLELVEGYNVLAWRASDSQTPSRGAVMRTIRSYVDDEVVHARLHAANFRVDGEILRPQLFADRCVTIPNNLRAAKSLKNDGMAHQDLHDCGDLYRAMLFVQCQLVRRHYVDSLAKERLDALDDFLSTFRRFRPRQYRKAQTILNIFEQHDVLSVAGHASILRELTAAEGVDPYMGLSVFRKQDGRYLLPWP